MAGIFVSIRFWIYTFLIGPSLLRVKNQWYLKKKPQHFGAQWIMFMSTSFPSMALCHPVCDHSVLPPRQRITGISPLSYGFSRIFTSVCGFSMTSLVFFGFQRQRSRWSRLVSTGRDSRLASRLWEEVLPSTAGLEVSKELLRDAWEKSGFRDPKAKAPLYRLVHVAFPHLFPTASTAKKALRRGYVLVDGENRSSSSLSPSEGSFLTAHVERSLPSTHKVSIDQRLEMWNAGKPESAQIRVLHHDQEAAWAVVNKPPGIHTSPVGIDAWQSLTLQSYLPALLEPPLHGTPCRSGPRPCHRLDMLVAGPVAVATSEEAMRSLNQSFQNRQVHKEYHATWQDEPGQRFYRLIFDIWYLLSYHLVIIVLFSF